MNAPTLQLLSWIDERPRSYAATMEAWRSNCPRLSVWEDALGDGLVQLESGPGGLSECRVVLTAHGRALLRSASVPA
jgi:hypothetical protein